MQYIYMYTCTVSPPDHSSTTSSQSSSHAKMSPMRLMQWAKTPAREDTMAEMNRKMQRALEEALMKNIHLQQVRDCRLKD